MGLNDLIKKLRGIKGLGTLALLFVAGLALVLFPFGGSDAAKEEKSFDCDEYVKNVENELSEMISHVSGVGSVKVMVTLESGAAQYYERDTKTRRTDNGTAVSAETEENLVFEDKKPILVKEIFPEIKGVAVVCDGARNAAVEEKIINLVSCALNVPTHRIYVTY